MKSNHTSCLYLTPCHITTLNFHPVYFCATWKTSYLFFVIVVVEFNLNINKWIKKKREIKIELILFTKLCKRDTIGQCKTNKKNSSDCNSKHFFLYDKTNQKVKVINCLRNVVIYGLCIYFLCEYFWVLTYGKNQFDEFLLENLIF